MAALLSLAGATFSRSEIVHHLQSQTAAQYAHGVRQQGWAPFPGTLWQRRCYDRVIRGDEELRRVREHILQHPLGWSLVGEG